MIDDNKNKVINHLECENFVVKNKVINHLW